MLLHSPLICNLLPGRPLMSGTAPSGCSPSTGWVLWDCPRWWPSKLKRNQWIKANLGKQTILRRLLTFNECLNRLIAWWSIVHVVGYHCGQIFRICACGEEAKETVSHFNRFASSAPLAHIKLSHYSDGLLNNLAPCQQLKLAKRIEITLSSAHAVANPTPLVELWKPGGWWILLQERRQSFLNSCTEKEAIPPNNLYILAYRQWTWSCSSVKPN